MAKKVVYSLLALSAVPAANANAAAVAAPAQGTQVQGEMAVADVQEVYQVNADKSDYKDVIDNLQQLINAGVNEIEGYIAATDDFNDKVDADAIKELADSLAEWKVNASAISQGLDAIKDKDEADVTDEEYLGITAKEADNAYIKKLNEIWPACRTLSITLRTRIRTTPLTSTRLRTTSSSTRRTPMKPLRTAPLPTSTRTARRRLRLRRPSRLLRTRLPPTTPTTTLIRR